MPKQLSNRMRDLALLAAAALLASACGSYSGDEQAGAVPPAPPPTGGSGGPTDAELEAAFQTTVWPILNNPNYPCVTCHVAGGSAAPAIADPNVTRAFRAVWDNGKVNLTTPANSRLARRLAPDQHHCWSNNCDADAVIMETAILQWAALVNWGGGSGGGGGGGTPVTGLVSQNVTLADGFEDQGQDRDQTAAIAYWDFKEGTGTIAADSSGVAPAIDLTLNGATWLSSYGLAFETGLAAAPATTSAKLYDRIADAQTGSQQYSIEAWLTPANTTQGDPDPSHIFSFGNNLRLRQRLYSYQAQQRSVNPNGGGVHQTDPGDQDLQARLQHVVVTYDRYRGRRIYVDARFTDDMDAVAPEALFNWNPGSNVTLGNSLAGDRQWEGQIRLLAIYDRVLPQTQIQQNYDAGVGKRLLLRFDTSQWAGAGSYLEFLVMELDNFSYLFCTPALVSNSFNTTVGGLRIMVNGQTSVTGQAFTHVNRVVSQNREPLSSLCSIIPKDLGPALDVFTVDFEYLAGYQDLEAPPPVPPLPPRQFGAALPGLGLRDFARVNAAMGAVTGVDPLTPAVDSTYLSLTQQMPPTYDLRTFASAQQVAITKLSLEYCDALVESPSLRTAFFGPAFDFNAAPLTAFASQADRDAVSQSITDHVVGANLTDQPSMLEMQPILDQLITDLTASCAATPCNATRTRTVVKAMCTAAVASAAASVH
ncbi:MAG TPA: LamG-like jellyroll fold domain-containing protein [Myxococcota bacterium]